MKKSITKKIEALLSAMSEGNVSENIAAGFPVKKQHAKDRSFNDLPFGFIRLIL